MEKPTLAPAFWQELADYNPVGVQLAGDDVRAWFDYVWLRYSTYGYRNHKRAIKRWWSRVQEFEIEAAIARAARIVDETETAELERLATAEQIDDILEHEHLQLEGNVTRIDHFAKLKRKQ